MWDDIQPCCDVHIGMMLKYVGVTSNHVSVMAKHDGMMSKYEDQTSRGDSQSSREDTENVNDARLLEGSILPMLLMSITDIEG